MLWFKGSVIHHHPSLAGLDTARQELQCAKEALKLVEHALAKHTSDRDDAKSSSKRAEASKLVEQARIARQEARFARNAAERNLRSLEKAEHDINCASFPSKRAKQLNVKGEVVAGEVTPALVSCSGSLLPHQILLTPSLYLHLFSPDSPTMKRAAERKLHSLVKPNAAARHNEPGKEAGTVERHLSRLALPSSSSN